MPICPRSVTCPNAGCPIWSSSTWPPTPPIQGWDSAVVREGELVTGMAAKERRWEVTAAVTLMAYARSPANRNQP